LKGIDKILTLKILTLPPPEKGSQYSFTGILPKPGLQPDGTAFTITCVRAGDFS